MRGFRHLYHLVLATATLVLISAPVFAIEYGGIGGRPANPDPEVPRSQSIFIYELEGGEAQQDGVTLSNNTSEEKTLEVYAVDAHTTNTGSFACRQRAEPVERVGSWINLESQEVTLDSGGQETIPFTIATPETVDVGEHNGCIVIAESAGTDTDTEDSSGVSLRFRSALRVAVTVPGDIIKELTFAGLEYQRGERQGFDEPTVYTVSPQLENTGNVSLDTEITVRMRTILGREATNSGTFPVLPHDRLDLNLAVTPSFWGGLYRVSAEATYNQDPDASLGQGSDENLHTIETNAGWVFVAPTLAAIAIMFGVLALLAAAVLAWLYRNGRVLNPAKNWSVYQVKQGEDIQQVARKHAVGWKKLARVNKLHPPYTLRSGQSLRVPETKSKKR